MIYSALPLVRFQSIMGREGIPGGQFSQCLEPVAGPNFGNSGNSVWNQSLEQSPSLWSSISGNLLPPMRLYHPGPLHSPQQCYQTGSQCSKYEHVGFISHFSCKSIIHREAFQVVKIAFGVPFVIFVSLLSLQAKRSQLTHQLMTGCYADASSHQPLTMFWLTVFGWSLYRCMFKIPSVESDTELGVISSSQESYCFYLASRCWG